MDVYAKNNVRVVGNADGPALLLAHGFGCDQNLWRLVVERLSRRLPHRPVRPRRSRSFGSSAWDAARYASLDGLRLGCARHRAASSTCTTSCSSVIRWAAMIGVLAVAAQPDRFAKLILLTPSPRYLDDGGYRGRFLPR